MSELSEFHISLFRRAYAHRSWMEVFPESSSILDWHEERASFYEKAASAVGRYRARSGLYP